MEEAYPCDACGLQGLSMFLEFHIGRNGESRSNLLGSQHFLFDFSIAKGFSSEKQVMAWTSRKSKNSSKDGSRI